MGQNEAKRVYLAGPMSGYRAFNYFAFEGAAHLLRARGYAVVSPTELDEPWFRDLCRASPDGKMANLPASVDGKRVPKWEELLERDFKEIENVDAVVVLPRWEFSSGATKEVAYARGLGKEILIYPQMTTLLKGRVGGGGAGGSCVTSTTHDEVIVTDPQTGGRKGQKLEQLGTVDPRALSELAKVGGFGAQKYERFNYLRGYAWSLSVDAAYRHFTAFLSGEDIDPESGLQHAAHLAWHALALTSFALRSIGTDDRAPK